MAGCIEGLTKVDEYDPQVEATFPACLKGDLYALKYIIEKKNYANNGTNIKKEKI